MAEENNLQDAGKAIANDNSLISQNSRIKNCVIEDELKQAYLDYSMSVIVGRALPDVRDGLKPVHRRILYSFWENNWKSSAKFVKSAKLVGAVIGNYHPHGDVAVYDSMVRLAQDFSLRYPLVKGQGNFGCFTADTKVKLTDGRDLSFAELVNEKKKGKRNFTYTIDDNHKIKIAEIKSPRLTKKNAEIMKVVLDNGKEIKCTLNHKFMLKDGNYKEAKDLKAGDSLMPSYFRFSTKEDDSNAVGYSMVFQPKLNSWDFAHVLSDEWNLNNSIYEKAKGRIRHHINFNKLDNNPPNIMRMNWKEHWQTYYNLTSDKHKNDSVYRLKLAEGRKNFWADENNRKNYSERLTKRNLENWKNEGYRAKMKAFLSQATKKYLKKHPEVIEQYRKTASATMKRLWQIPEYKKLFNETISAANKNRKTNLTGKKKFIKVCLHLKENHLVLNKENFEKARKDVFGAKSITTWDLGFKKYYDSNLNLLLCEINGNHKVARIEFLGQHADVYDLSIDKTHNFCLAAGVFVHNSVDGDNAASYRYTEAKLSKISDEMLQDIEKETVLMVPNFDNTLKEPTVLPARIPQLLINGSSGIAVGMATNIPPHNILEVCSAVSAVIDNPEITTLELMNHIKGPDFPTGAIICGISGIRGAYETGKGKITVRAKTECTEKKILVTEIPYQVNKAQLIENIAELVKDKKLEGISNIRDESDKEGLTISIDIKQGFNSEIVLNNLFKHTALETTFGCIMLALVDNEPKVLSLKDILFEFVKHRKDVVLKRSAFDLRKAEERAHILEGLKIALLNIDKIVPLIKQSKDVETARNALVTEFKLTEMQANAILDMKLQRLTALENQKIIDELKALGENIIDFRDILNSEKRVLDIIRAEMKFIKDSYGDERRTQILGGFEDIIDEDLIKKEKVVITMSHSGYVKRLPLDTYKSQKRGGRGVIAASIREEDYVENFFTTDSHATILLFSNLGKVYWLKAYEIPEGNRYAKGTAVINLIKLEANEKVQSMIAVDEFLPYNFVVMATKKGIVKKTSLAEYSRPRQGGVIAINLRDNDSLVNVVLTNGSQQLILATKDGRASRFKESDVREVGRASIGVRGINVRDSEVIAMEICNAPYVLTVTDKGYGKRSEVNNYRLINRGGSGVINIKSTDKNGIVVGIKVIGERDDVMFITKNGVLIRTPASGISIVGRNSQGVRLMKLEDSDSVISLTKVINEEVDIEAVKEEFKPSEDVVDVNGSEDESGKVESNEEPDNTKISEDKDNSAS